MSQVQNLNNIMAFPLENVLKSELRDSRLVSQDFIIKASLNTNQLLAEMVNSRWWPAFDVWLKNRETSPA